jgi:L-iditol 2-dehydrogenase
MECSGASDSPLKACQMVKKTGAVAIIATYHNDTVPIPANIVNFNEIKLVGSKANPNVSDQVLHFFATGAIQGEKLITHTFPLEEYEKAVDIFEHKKEGSIKVVINP